MFKCVSCKAGAKCTKCQRLKTLAGYISWALCAHNIRERCIGMNGYGGQPIFILPEGTIRSTGKDAQSRNITAAKAVAESVRTTLGPKGMDKMLVNSIGDVVITNDGVTILEEMDVR